MRPGKFRTDLTCLIRNIVQGATLILLMAGFEEQSVGGAQRAMPAGQGYGVLQAQHFRLGTVAAAGVSKNTSGRADRRRCGPSFVWPSSASMHTEPACAILAQDMRASMRGWGKQGSDETLRNFCVLMRMCARVQECGWTWPCREKNAA